MKTKTWKTFDWAHESAADGSIELACPICGNEAHMPTFGHPGSEVIGSIGLCLVFERPSNRPPSGYMAPRVQCRSCRNVFEQGDHE